MNGDNIIDTASAAARRLIVGALFGIGALLVPGVAHADCVRADLDGDGVRDRIEVSPGSRELAIRFSTTRRWERLSANDVVLTFVVADVDRDGDPDLVADTRRAGLQIWINKGRGLFTSRSRPARARHLRVVLHRSRPAVRGIQAASSDDSVLNDPNTLFIVSSAPARARFVAVCQAPIVAPAPLTKVTYPRRTPRGPPPVTAS